MRPASGEVNRAVHTHSTAVHILVLRLSTPAPYVAAPSLPHDSRPRWPTEGTVDFDAVRAVRVPWNGCLSNPDDKRSRKSESHVSKRTFQPNNRRRAKTHGFRLRMRTRAGRAIIAARRYKGRTQLSA